MSITISITNSTIKGSEVLERFHEPVDDVNIALKDLEIIDSKVLNDFSSQLEHHQSYDKMSTDERESINKVFREKNDTKKFVAALYQHFRSFAGGVAVNVFSEMISKKFLGG